MGHVFLLVSMFKESCSSQGLLSSEKPWATPPSLQPSYLSTAPGGWNERSQDDQAGEKPTRKQSLFVNLDSSLIPPSTWGRATTQMFHETRLGSSMLLFPAPITSKCYFASFCHQAALALHCGQRWSCLIFSPGSTHLVKDSVAYILSKSLC